MRNRAEIKAEAKGILREARVSPYLVTLLVIVIGFALDRVVDMARGGSLFYSYEFTRRYYEAIASGSAEALERLIRSMPESSGSSFFYSTLSALVMLVLNGGYYIYCMGIRQGAEMPFSSLTDGLAVAGKLIWCSIQMGVKIFLWSLLFWIPGIIAAYRYRFAYYNILTDSSLSAGEAIRLSCRQTEGMKGQLFALDLSFIGWNILSALTMGLLNIWLTPYTTLCDLAYFEEGQKNVGRSPYGGNSGTTPRSGDPWGEL